MPAMIEARSMIVIGVAATPLSRFNGAVWLDAAPKAVTELTRQKDSPMEAA